MMYNLIKALFALILSIITFFLGYYYGTHLTIIYNLTKQCVQRLTDKSMIMSNNSNDFRSDENIFTSKINFSIETSLYKVDGTVRGGILQEAFHLLKHPGMPFSTEIIIDLHHSITASDKVINPYNHCDEIYLTRTGSYTSMTNKCVAIAFVPDGNYHSPYRHSHRSGFQAGMKDRYQNDLIDEISLRAENYYLPLFLEKIDEIVRALQSKVGDPIVYQQPPVDHTTTTTTSTKDKPLQRRAITIMVVNEGVLDLLMNFLCSCRMAGIDVLKNLVIFIGQKELSPIIESMGAIPFYHEALGLIPKQAAGFYGDGVFGVLMWLKATSIYVATKAGYDVLFQDADLVWIKDPFPILKGIKYDISFMDDGARTPRFAPFYVNSGFYFQKYTNHTLYLMERMIKACIEILQTKSHQSILTKHIAESHDLFGIQFYVLDQEQFPSGISYHHNKSYIDLLKQHEIIPRVFHMCWTTSRKEKLTYFKDLGLWFLADESTKDGRSNMCLNSTLLVNTMRYAYEHNKNIDILNQCCHTGKYWEYSLNNSVIK